ncbi:MAG: hypothetical protein ACLP3B_07720 [Syntrophobacteraceae bacterium]
MWPKSKWHVVLLALGTLLTLLGILTGWQFHSKYAVPAEMEIPVKEFSTAEYPEDPADRSVLFSQYAGRKLKLVQKDATHFDFILESTNRHTADVIFRNIDVSLMTPSEPDWTKNDKDLELIALTDRQWNRQQVSFGLHSPEIEVSGGDGFERANLFSAELAKNCLNAGLWEILLFVHENGIKSLYYQCWFTFPLGHYKDILSRDTGVSYWSYWYRMEHWVDPTGTPMRLELLRSVKSEREVPVFFNTNEPIFMQGEQIL